MDNRPAIEKSQEPAPGGQGAFFGLGDQFIH